MLGFEGSAQFCGCKGIRSCLICEQFGSKVSKAAEQEQKVIFNYDSATGFAVHKADTGQEALSFSFPGIILLKDFVSEEEEMELVRLMDLSDWKKSQSGRFKQDYGPKVNFKKQKVKVGSFSGLPSFSQNVIERMKKWPILCGFQPVEQCNLDYHPSRGSAIDPHFDDNWLWGERLVSLNLLSPTTLSMSSDFDDLISVSVGHMSDEHQTVQNLPASKIKVRIHLPQRSLVVVYGDARFKWMHAIQRQDILQRRICITFRELSPDFLQGGVHESLGSQLLDIAHGFQGMPL
ncbi:alpha-ketoglutarate-dependent dioxygenase alkB homolog 4 [Polypterus senegalus]|uniref:alpha-ketoglutarate-dependent dioxygenase alkB homolog 4 n=1 Tax=Polypterus senegalus TaxID=55291 RepID=UPI0019668000|nr:alpha-ketoglutarate-dependent dioxygenase alkB homolog 4 [Polypterus senegalus]